MLEWDLRVKIKKKRSFFEPKFTKKMVKNPLSLDSNNLILLAN